MTRRRRRPTSTRPTVLRQTQVLGRPGTREEGPYQQTFGIRRRLACVSTGQLKQHSSVNQPCPVPETTGAEAEQSRGRGTGLYGAAYAYGTYELLVEAEGHHQVGDVRLRVRVPCTSAVPHPSSSPLLWYRRHIHCRVVYQSTTALYGCGTAGPCMRFHVPLP